MDKERYQLLAHLASLEQPTLGDPQLAKHQSTYRYLLKRGYLFHKDGTLPVIVTRIGRKALESYEQNERLLALQEQNTAIQNSLKNIQLFLAVLTAISILFQIAVFFFP